MRKKYGTTWWGKQWLNALTNIDYSNRLPRGKTYANKGLAYDIEIENNRITAKVKGSSYKPYKVNFTIPAFTSNEKAKIIQIVTSNPLYLSKLLNRELILLEDNQLNNKQKDSIRHTELTDDPYFIKLFFYGSTFKKDAFFMQ